ncbi:hypothetical protein RclHR1_00550011 [Rhizophagus clarus]|uniref:Uncharacterized protein n=1 Tax=Rhizophagus clarus TaxID=94130 RepID=A0A2Z6RML7_9GLOM|nr:hypothetical protein RclHR1_00550011 [Rhizophagus clarus]
MLYDIRSQSSRDLSYRGSQGTRINRPRPNKCIDIILDKDFNKIVPKPVNNHPVFDIEYLRAYLMKLPSNGYSCKDALHALITEGHESYYHVFCLFESSGQGVTKTFYDSYGGREVAIGYYRPIIHNSKMAICFNCWKLVKITDINQKKRHISVDGRDMEGKLEV